MYKFVKKTSLFIYIITFFNSINAQNFYRKFPIPPDINSQEYILGESAPITPTSDGGYLLNYNYGYPDIHGGPVNSVIIKTDANFTPIWKKNLWGNNGKKLFTFNDGSSIIYQNGFSLNLFSFQLEKIDSNGLPIWNKYNYETSSKIDIIDATLINTNSILFAGSKNLNPSWPYGGNLQPVLMEFDDNGNYNQGIAITQFNPFPFPTNSGSGFLEAFSKSNQQDFYTLIRAVSGSDTYMYLLKFNSSYNIVWGKRFNINTNTSFFGSIYSMSTLSNGDILIVGIYNYNNCFIRIDSNGNTVWSKTIPNFSGITKIKEIGTGDLIATGLVSDTNSAKNLIMKLDTNGNVIWSKKYSNSFITGEPFEKSPSEWYFTGFSYSYTSSENHPFIFSTDQNGSNACNVEDVTFNTQDNTLTLIDYNIFYTTPLTLLTPQNYISNPSVSQSYEDGCISLNTTNFEKSDNILISPNPSNGVINLNSDALIEKVTITNNIGQKIETLLPNSRNISITIENKGIYLVTIQTQKGISTRKVIIEK